MRLRTVLDGVYAACALLAGASLVAIGVLVTLQIGSRMLGYLVPSADEFAGYCMVASLFLGMPYTFRSGAHVRVELLMDKLDPHRRRALERLCLVVGTCVSVYFAWFVVDMTVDSYRFGDRSQGILATPLWIPQSSMAFGLVVLSVAMFDLLVRSFRTGADQVMVRSPGATVRTEGR